MANGIPVNQLPTELLAEPKEDLRPIPLTWLRRKPVEVYKLAPGDVLGVYIEHILGEENELPPINLPPAGTDLPPSVGYPIAVGEDGTLALPWVAPINVRGMSLNEAREAIIKAYGDASGILLQPQESRILVSLIQLRKARILVVREDSAPGTGAAAGFTTSVFGTARAGAGSRRGTGSIVELPVSEADVLSVLTQTGGLPGTDAKNEVIVQRGYAGESGFELERVPENWQQMEHGTANRQTVRIPLRLLAGEPPPFAPEDVILQDGDIVLIEARDTEFYYTTGLLPSVQVPLPRDYDLDVVEAITQVGGTLAAGGINGNNLSGGLIAGGVGGPSPSLLTVLRRLPDGRQVRIRVDLNEAMRDPRENILVQSGDILVLQETPGEALTRYLTGIFNVNMFTQFVDRGSASGVANVNLP